MMRQSKRVVDAAVAAGVSHMVYVGASGTPTTEVAHWGWHRFVEAYIEQSGLGYTHLQPESFIQNIDSFGFLQGNVLLDPIGGTRWSWVDGEDVGKLAAAGLPHSNAFASQVWRLGFASATFADVANHLQDRLQTSVSIQQLDPDNLYTNAVESGADHAYMAWVRDQFKLNAAGVIEGIADTFDGYAFQQATGDVPAAWSDFLKRRQRNRTNSNGRKVHAQ